MESANIQQPLLTPTAPSVADSAVGASMPCTKCGSRNRKATMQVIPYHGSYIKYIPQYRLTCAGCGKWIKFLVQTPQLIEAFNKKLTEIYLVKGVKK